MMNKTFPKLILFFLFCILFVSCKKDYTCSDGEQNQGETGIDCGGEFCPACDTTSSTCSDGFLNGNETEVDCGGDCPACDTTEPTAEPNPEPSAEPNPEPTAEPSDMGDCTDNIMNGTETGVDCGGIDCPPCEDEPALPEPSFTATINGAPWTATNVEAILQNDLRLVINAANADDPGSQISLAFEDNIAEGTFNLLPDITFYNTNLNDQDPLTDTICLLEADTNEGTIDISSADTTLRLVSGTFSFTCTDTDGVINTIEGRFENVHYM